MKLILFLTTLLTLNAGALAGNVPVYPDCYRGTLRMADGQVQNVFLTFGSTEGKWARVSQFVIGNSSHPNSGRVEGDQVTINENDDYIPGGNASYNVDIRLQFAARAATGSYRYYRFANGYGGFGQSKPETLVAEGTFSLKKCRIQVVDQ